MVRGRRAEEVVELVPYVTWTGRKRGEQERRGICAFQNLVQGARRPEDRGLEIAKNRWGRMLREALPGMDLDSPREKGVRLRMQMQRILPQREGWY